MSDVIVSRWIDMDGSEFNKIETPNLVKKIIKMGMDTGAITVDKNGYMWHGKNPIHAELDGEIVGLRLATKAAN